MKDYVQMNKDFVLNSVDMLHDVFSKCYVQNTDRVLLHASNLPDAFFDISSKAGGRYHAKAHQLPHTGRYCNRRGYKNKQVVFPDGR